MWQVKREVLLMAIEAANNCYPDEFFALIGGYRKKKIVDEMVVVPAVYGENYSLVKTWLVPIDRKIVGTLHSHPSPNNRPSPADVRTFAHFGDINLILGHPYRLESVAAYDALGKTEKIELV